MTKSDDVMMRDYYLYSYLAGLMDGEGSFSIQVSIRDTKKGSKYVNINPRITMSLKYGNEVLDLLVKTFGGQIYDSKDEMKRWNLSKRELVEIATETLLPFLHIKKEIAERFLEAVKIKERDNKSIMKISEIALTLNNLNSKRNFKRMNSLDEIMEFVKI